MRIKSREEKRIFLPRLTSESMNEKEKRNERTTHTVMKKMKR